MSQRKKQPNKNNPPQWRRMDLHLHTPASADYRESNVTYLDILKKAEQKGLDIIAITDHNTAAGYRRYLDEIQDLELLERRNRLTDEEKAQLAEFRRLREKILVLPGFELTATLGFHVLAVFPPETTVRELEHLLLNLHVPADRLDVGSGEVGATTDVLTAYRLINEAGGLAIAAHANSSHGVAMPGFDFGGQTRIAYTQDENLHALEVTDLTSKSRRRTQMFFSGTKPEYPRKMHCIQGSDAHRLNGIPGNNQELGVGDRPTEILLPEASFETIMDVLTARDFSKTRPYVPTALNEYDPLYAAREEGESLVQAFHESIGKHGIDRRILQDVVALANTNGGTIYIGASANIRAPIQGVQKPVESAHQLRNDINKHIVPPLDIQIDTLKTGGKTILQMIVPRGSDVPYALDSTQIFVRSENETSLAVRDEIMNLVRDVLAVEFAAQGIAPRERAAQDAETLAPTVTEPMGDGKEKIEAAPPPKLPSAPPHTGVEIVASKTRAKGDRQYTLRDLRNNRVIHNVTRSSARKLWQYAINEYDHKTFEHAPIRWLGEVGILKASERAGKLRYDVVQRDSNGELHVYYGVTDDGIHGVWRDLVESVGAPTIVTEEEPEGASEILAEEAMPEAVSAENGEMEQTDAESLAAELTAESGADMSAMVLPYDTELFEPLTLLTIPGRGLFPSPVYDLSPSTPETDDVSGAVAQVRAEMEQAHAPEILPDVPTADSHTEPFTDAPQTELPEQVEIVHAAPFVASARDETAADAPAPRAETALLISGTLSIETPTAIEIANAPMLFAAQTPTEIISGETLAPILESAETQAPDDAPQVAVNLVEQIVMPPNEGAAELE